MKRFILGSASVSRARILKAAGIGFEVLTSNVDEDVALAQHEQQVGKLSPSATAEFLAQCKASDVASQQEAAYALVLGCDSVFEFEGQSYGKPFIEDVAIQRWLMMRGKTGTLHTSHTLIDNRVSSPTFGQAQTMTSSSNVTFAYPSESQIREYVSTQEPLRCAGGFTIDGRAAAFISRIEGDHNAIIGISINQLTKLLEKFSVDVVDLWEPSLL